MGEEVAADRDHQRQHCLVLGVERSIEGEAGITPGTGRIEELDERNCAFSIGTERDATHLVRAGEEPLGARLRESRCAIGEQTRDFRGAQDIRVRLPFLHCEIEAGDVALGSRPA